MCTITRIATTGTATRTRLMQSAVGARVWRTLLRCVGNALLRRKVEEQSGGKRGEGCEWGYAIVGIYYCQKNLVGQN
jgi:hypothetical protein